LTNVLRHAQASRVEVAVSVDDAAFVLRVSDNGRGLPGGTAGYGRGSLGLLGMRERAALVGASVVVSAGAAGGTEVVVRVPTSAPGEPAQG
jgi:signal transduction histidine kinase